MKKTLSPADYMEYIKNVYEKLQEKKDYVTSLDAATGDGDHWINLNMGFTALAEKANDLADAAFPELLRKIGMIMMSTIGGSSGALYGSAYMEASRHMTGKEELAFEDIGGMLKAMCEGIMKRGKCEPGMKTMLDAIYPASECFIQCQQEGYTPEETCKLVKEAAKAGAASTADMPAMKGRACYQPEKGVGCIDAGAVTMSYQIEALMDSFSCL